MISTETVSSEQYETPNMEEEANVMSIINSSGTYENCPIRKARQAMSGMNVEKLKEERLRDFEADSTTVAMMGFSAFAEARNFQNIYCGNCVFTECVDYGQESS